MKTLTTLLILIGLMITACDYDLIPTARPIEIGNIYDYTFEGSEEIPEFNDINEVVRYVGKNISYTPDKNDYWQTPEETFYRRDENNKMMGDCEDFVIFTQFLIESQLHISTFLAFVEFPDSKDYHAFLFTNEYYYEVQATGYIIPLPHLRNDIKIIYIIPYSEVMWMTVNYHNNVGKYE
jgi:hypothetical protein